MTGYPLNTGRPTFTEDSYKKPQQKIVNNSSNARNLYILSTITINKDTNKVEENVNTFTPAIIRHTFS
jgi:hypothetical protein